jgi:plasmid stability protein
MSPTPAASIDAAVAASPLLPRYGTAIDRESAREILTARMNAAEEAYAAEEAAKETAKLDAEYAKQQAAIDKARAAADKKAQQEYERLLRKTSGSTRTTSRRSTTKTPLEQILGSKSVDSLLSGVIRGVFRTGRR